MNKNIKYNNKGYTVLTSNGYKPFAGVACMGKKETIKIYFDDKWIQVTNKHQFFDADYNEIYTKDLRIDDIIMGLNGSIKISKIEKSNIQKVYDLIEVEGNRYYTDDILSHNCQFISFEETLISGHILKSMYGEDPYKTTGRVRWYTPLKANRIYLIGLDPSMGTGGDNAAITVWSLPEFEQVAEWIHNKTDVKGQIRVLMDILVDINNELKSHSEQEGKPEIYWSVENNTLGEAALQVIEATGEDMFPGDFVHEPRKKRKGFTTSTKTKIEACARLKSLIESDKMKPKSKILARELKSFVKDNRSFSAKRGENDDTVMSSLLSIRILNEIQNWDHEVYERLADVINLEDEDVDPMPLIVA